MRLPWIFLLLLAALPPTYGQTPASLIANGNFAQRSPNRTTPDGWNPFAHEGKYQVSVDPTGGRDGSPCVKVEGAAESANGRAGVLSRTETFPAPRGLRASVLTRGTSGRRAIVVQFFDAANPKEIVTVQSATVPGEDAEWREFTAEFEIPRALRRKPIQVVVLLYLYGTGSCAWDDLSLAPVTQVELKVRDEETSPYLIRPNPPDGAVVAQNPPDFRWRPEKNAETYTLQLCRDPGFTGPSLITEEGIPLNCYNLSRPLEPGRWYWRIRFTDDEGQHSSFGRARSFEVPAGAVQFVLPPMDEVLKKHLRRDHPRLYVTREELPALRARRQAEGKAWWEQYEPLLERLLKAEPAAEPVDCDLRGRPIDLEYFKIDSRLRAAAGQVSSGLWNLAFGYLITGEPRYAEGAKRYLLHLSQWDPDGATGFRSNDQVFRDLLIKSAMAYDWIADTLSPEERAPIQKAIADRCRIMYRIYATNNKILNYPLDSHGQSNIGYLGLATLAIAGEVPEADEWTAYTIRVYSANFPPWGGDDGGWSQGVSYWKWSCSFALQYLDALKSATEIDLYQKPWFRNNGLFKLYFQPPWCGFSYFGDTGPYGVDATDKRNLERYAAVYRNPYYQWYADLVSAPPDSGPYGFLFPRANVPLRPPVDLPQARVSNDIGWVAMYSHLYAPDGVMLLAKASPYGSFNHSHADQNSFVLAAFGEPLAIDSGYYPWYHSPHHKEWAIRTKAHNTILVDGEGQKEMEITARGQSVAFHAGKSYAYWCGEAAEAYAGRLNRFRRHILHLRPDAFVIYDDLESPQPATFQWLLHAAERMEIDPARQSVLVRRGQARLRVQHLLPAGLNQSQDDDFGVPPEARGGSMPNQWHYRAETREKAASQAFLTLLQAFREATPPAQTGRLVRGEGATGLVLGSEVIAFATPGAPRTRALGSLRFDGAVAASRQGAGTARYLLVSGTRLQHGATTLIASSAPCRVEAGWVGGSFESAIATDADANIRLHVGKRPTGVRLDGKTLAPGKWTYDAKSGTIRLRVAKGEHALSVVPAGVPQPAPAGTLRVTVGQAEMKEGAGVSRTANNTVAAWVVVHARQGIYRARLSGEAAARARVWVGKEAITNGSEVVLQGSDFLLVEVPVGTPLPRIAFEEAYQGKSVPAQPLAKDDPRLAAGQGIEAESDATGLHGTPQIYTHRPFLSGGKGVSLPAVSGLGCRWVVNVPQTGRYLLVLKAATHEPMAERVVRIDGKPAGGNPIASFASTGGYGTTPQEWRHHVVCDAQGQPAAIELTAGEHHLEILTLSGLLNLDYWLLIPLEE